MTAHSSSLWSRLDSSARGWLLAPCGLRKEVPEVKLRNDWCEEQSEVISTSSDVHNMVVWELQVRTGPLLVSEYGCLNCWLTYTLFNTCPKQKFKGYTQYFPYYLTLVPTKLGFWKGHIFRAGAAESPWSAVQFTARPHYMPEEKNKSEEQSHLCLSWSLKGEMRGWLQPEAKLSS